jgi:tetratricopeptide (TPR) repeat protein
MLLAGSQADERDRARFLSEARAVARLQHPGIVQIFEVGDYTASAYFSLEYVSGGSLAERLRRGALPVAEAVRLVEALAGAVHFAHQRNVIHRDIKPANVLLQTVAGSGGPPEAASGLPYVPKLTDFGLAKTLDSDIHHTRSGTVVGTPGYMAPEQADPRGVVGPTTDVYALGVLLFELVTGRLPFLGDTPVDVMIKVAQQEAPRPSRFAPGLARDLETVILKCLEKSPRQRYVTAEALAEDLRRVAALEPIRARPVANWERACRWARRRPALAGLAGAVVLCLAALLATWGVQAHAAQRRRQEAVTLLDRARTAAWEDKWEKVPGLLETLRATLPHGEDRSPFAEAMEELHARAKRALDARQTFGKFERARDDALFQALFEAALASSNRGAIQKGATLQRVRHALSLVGASVRQGPADNDFFSPSQANEVRRGCYELLLVLAETLAQPLPHQPLEHLRDTARQALAVLDTAQGLGLQTHAYHLRRARYLEQAGQPQAAEQQRHLARKLPPESYLDHFLTGSEHFGQGRTRAAEQAFFAALRREPRQFWALFCLALCHVQQKQYLAARSDLTGCLEQKSDSVWLYLLRGVVLARLELHREADADFTTALGMLKEVDDSWALYALCTNRAVSRLECEDYAGAKADLVKAIELRPDRFEAYLTLAHIHREQKDLPAALAALERGLQEARKRFDAGKLDVGTLLRLHRQRFGWHLKGKDEAAALGELQRILALPGLAAKARAEAHRERGQLLHRARKLDDALAAYDAALKADPGSTDTLGCRAELLLAQRRYAEALADFDRYLLGGGKPVARTYHGRALARAQLGQHQAAIGDFTLALALKSDGEGLHLQRGLAYLACQNWKDAAADFEEVLRREPGSAEGYRGRSVARLHLGKVREAVADAELLVRHAGRDAKWVFEAACLLAKAAGQTPVDRPQPASERLRIQERAVVRLRQALECLPAEKRAAFWRQKVQPERAFEPVKRHPSFVLLQRRYDSIP